MGIQLFPWRKGAVHGEKFYNGIASFNRPCMKHCWVLTTLYRLLAGILFVHSHVILSLSLSTLSLSLRCQYHVMLSYLWSNPFPLNLGLGKFVKLFLLPLTGLNEASTMAMPLCLILRKNFPVSERSQRDSRL